MPARCRGRAVSSGRRGKGGTQGGIDGALHTVPVEEIHGLVGLILEDHWVAHHGAIAHRGRLAAVDEDRLGTFAGLDLDHADLVLEEEAAVHVATAHGARVPDITVERRDRPPHAGRQHAVRDCNAICTHFGNLGGIAGTVAEVHVLSVAGERRLAHDSGGCGACRRASASAKLGRALLLLGGHQRR